MHTVDTIMPNLSNLRVHIAPVGFEIDRIVIPAKEMKADKVWLLVHDNPHEDKATPFIEKIQKQLKKAKIKVEIVNAEKDNYTQARFASLDQNIIQPLLEKWKFIDVEKIGRTRWVKINQDGINATEFL